MKKRRFFTLFLAILLLFTIALVFIITFYPHQTASDSNPSLKTEAAASDSPLSPQTSESSSDSSSNSSSDSEPYNAVTDTDTNKEGSAYSKSTDNGNNSSASQESKPEDSDMATDLEINSDTNDTATIHPERYTYMNGFYHEPITDAIKDRINGLSYKDDCTVAYDDLRYLSVMYYDFNNEVQTGEIICNKLIAEDLLEIFYELYVNQYQIDKIRLVDEYNADDDLSCADNNTSCFNFRSISGSSTLSNHALGLAIDINPFYNPYVTYPDGNERISPEGSEPYADRSADFPHKIDENDLCYKLFTEHGFSWGGNWKSLKDYQHFEYKLK